MSDFVHYHPFVTLLILANGDLTGNTTMTKLGICRVLDHHTYLAMISHLNEGFHQSLIKVVPPVHCSAASHPAMALSITLPQRQVRIDIQPRFSATRSAIYCPYLPILHIRRQPCIFLSECLMTTLKTTPQRHNPLQCKAHIHLLLQQTAFVESTNRYEQIVPES